MVSKSVSHDSNHKTKSGSNLRESDCEVRLKAQDTKLSDLLSSPQREAPHYRPPCAGGVYDCEACELKANCSRDIYFCRDAFLYLPTGQNISCPDYSFSNYRCTHGGGTACIAWRTRSDRMIKRKTFKEALRFNGI